MELNQYTYQQYVACAVEEARAGDFGTLIVFLKCAKHSPGELTSELTPALCDVLIDILLGKLKRRRGAGKSYYVHERNFAIALAVAGRRQDAPGMKVDAIVAEVAAKFRVKPRAVYGAMRTFPGLFELLEDIHRIRQGLRLRKLGSRDRAPAHTQPTIAASTATK
jgi:hypothetical protein